MWNYSNITFFFAIILPFFRIAYFHIIPEQRTMHIIARTFNKINSPLFLPLYEFSKEFLLTKR